MGEFVHLGIMIPNLYIGSCDANPLITKTYLYNFDPLKPHFYIVKLGFTGVYIIIPPTYEVCGGI